VTLVAAGIRQLTRSVAVGRHYTTGGVFPVIPFRTFPLSEAGTAWTASTDSGPRVVLVPD
jgi:hypothetical protein